MKRSLPGQWVPVVVFVGLYRSSIMPNNRPASQRLGGQDPREDRGRTKSVKGNGETPLNPPFTLHPKPGRIRQHGFRHWSFLIPTGWVFPMGGVFTQENGRARGRAYFSANPLPTSERCRPRTFCLTPSPSSLLGLCRSSGSPMTTCCEKTEIALT